jgi:hypothetical protein
MSGTIDSWNFTEEQLSQYMQDVKLVIMQNLHENDLISDETYEEYTRRKFLVLRKPSFFSRMWKKYFNYSGDHSYIIIATAENLSIKEDEEEPNKSSKPELKVIPLTEKNSE